MKTPTIGFIGGGRVTRILLQAFANKKINLLQASVYDSDKEVTKKLKKRFPDIHIRSLEKVAAQQVVILALHPPMIPEALEKMAHVMTPKTILASLAPKISSTAIATMVPHVKKILRTIPIAPSVINEGFNPIWFAPGFPSDEKEVVLQMLDFLGTTLEVEEKKLEAYCVISAMAPTFFWFQWKKVVELGVEFGLEPLESGEALLQCLYGSLETFFTSGIPTDEVLDLIPCKPIEKYEKEICDIYDKELRAQYQRLTQ